MSRRRRRRALAVGGILVVAAALLPSLGSDTSEAGSTAPSGPRVLVLDRAVPAGQAVDPGHVRLVTLPAGAVPAGALTRLEDVAFREAVVALPPRLPLVPALLRRPAAGAPSLAPGERAVGVRVDDVTGLPRLLAVGSRVDVLVSVRGGQAMRAETVAGNVEVIAEPAETPGGEGWAIVLRLPAAIAATVAAAQADGREIRLLSRSGAP